MASTEEPDTVTSSLAGLLFDESEYQQLRKHFLGRNQYMDATLPQNGMPSNPGGHPSLWPVAACPQWLVAAHPRWLPHPQWPPVPGDCPSPVASRPWYTHTPVHLTHIHPHTPAYTRTPVHAYTRTPIHP
jgi:hypothetical protein